MKILEDTGVGGKRSCLNKMSPKSNKVMEQGTTCYSNHTSYLQSMLIPSVSAASYLQDQ